MDLARLRERHQAALDGLARNTIKVYGFDRPVLIEGHGYPGIWLECGPLEALVYGRYAPEVAVASHEIFFHHQREDGYFPCWIWAERTGASQIQMVVPIAATALETADLVGDEAFLARAYDACSRWDAWLRHYRDTRGTGLCEVFCEYDTGHDNSPRFHGVPKACPNDDARLCPDVAGLPWLAPDLSATVYGGRKALAEMARRLGRDREAERWADEAETLRQRIIELCFDPEDECFYDLDRDGRFVKVRCDLLTRVMGEGVPDPALFERVWRRYLSNPDEFWTPYPFPSVSIADPQFVRDLPPNSWGGASQALTALRAPRWMTAYGKQAELEVLMRAWVEAIVAADKFQQQLNPWTGECSTSDWYSPCMCVLVEFVERLGLLDRASVGAATPKA